MVRDLEPARVPASCERCGKTELLPENEDVWAFVCEYPGVLISNGFSPRLQIDYAAVRELATELGIAGRAPLIRALEAVARGYNNSK